MYQPKNEFIKKVVFNDDIKIIGVSEPHTDFENEKKILTHLDEMNQYEGNPKKLFSEDSTFQAAENPNVFLQGLHNVMAKKLQMTDTQSSDEIAHKSHECIDERQDSTITSLCVYISNPLGVPLQDIGLDLNLAH